MNYIFKIRNISRVTQKKHKSSMDIPKANQDTYGATRLTS